MGYSVETRPWIQCIRHPITGQAPYPFLRPAGVDHAIDPIYPSPYISDAGVIAINYMLRGSYDDVFSDIGIDTTMEEIREIFAFYGLPQPRKFSLRHRLIHSNHEDSCYTAVGRFLGKMFNGK